MLNNARDAPEVPWFIREWIKVDPEGTVYFPCEGAEHGYLRIKPRSKGVDHTFTCEICGTKYEENELDAYVKCVNTCAKSKREELEKERKAKLQQEKELRWHELLAAQKHFEELAKAYCKDYNVSLWTNDLKDLFNHFFP